MMTCKNYMSLIWVRLATRPLTFSNLRCSHVDSWLTLLRIDVPLNYLRNFRSHLTENTVRLLQKFQSLNGVEKTIVISSFDAINIVLMSMSCVLS